MNGGSIPPSRSPKMAITMRPTLLAAALLIVTVPAMGADGPGSGSWDRFGVGSWVVFQRTTEAPGEKTDDHVKLMIIDQERGRPVLGLAQMVNGRFETRFRTGRHVAAVTANQLGMHREDRGMSKIRIDDTAYHVRRERYATRQESLDLERTLTLWRSSEAHVPSRDLVVDRGANIVLGGDVLRAEYVVRLDDRTTTYTVRITELASPVSIDDRALSCAVEVGTASVDDRGETMKVESRRYLSGEVPGHVVSMHTTVRTDELRFVESQQATAFHATPPDPADR